MAVEKPKFTWVELELIETMLYEVLRQKSCMEPLSDTGVAFAGDTYTKIRTLVMQRRPFNYSRKRADECAQTCRNRLVNAEVDRRNKVRMESESA